MNTEKKLIDLETFKPYERPPQPSVIDSTPSSGFQIKQESQMVSIKQEESTKMIKHEEDGIHGSMQYSRERGLYIPRYGGQEQFGFQYDSRSQSLQSSRQQISQQLSQPMLQQNDRPRPPPRRNSKFT